MAVTTTATQTGVIPAPSGWVVDLENPTRKQDRTAYIVSGLGMIFCTLCLLMRIYTKAKTARAFGMEDVCMIIAWMFSLAIQGLIIFNFKSFGEGTHLWEITDETWSLSQKVILVAAVIYVPTLAFAKFSLLLLYHRISQQKVFRMMIYGVMMIELGSGFGIMFAIIFACNPIEKNWDVSITDGTCINRAGLYLATAIVNIISDIMCLILPIPIVLKLQVPRIQKLGIICMFGVGSITVVTSIVRLVTLLPMLTDTDQPWAVATPSVWIVVESNLIVICGCLPALRKFLGRFAPALIGEGSSRRHGGTSNTFESGPGGGGQSYELKSSRKYNFPRRAYNVSSLFDERELDLGKGVVINSDWQMRHSDDNSEKAIVGPMSIAVNGQTVTERNGPQRF